MRSNNILVTGAAGFIGSHTCLELLNEGYQVVAVDNLVNSKVASLTEVEKLAGKSIKFYQIDLNELQSLERVFKENSIDAVIHFAGYKAVGESVANPLLYYHNNVSASINLLNCMEKFSVNNIVFSSSCTVYGKPENVPVTETDPLQPTNPYGQSKLMVERVLEDYYYSKDEISVSILRYFNPIGAHPTGRIGEDPNGIPNNLLPYIALVATKQMEVLKIFGNDYNTKDGTGVRDYIHVVDLALAHIKAVEELISKDTIFEIYNLGTGEGYSVLDVVNMFENVSRKKIPYEIVEKRPGDVAITFANPSKANNKLNWLAKRGLSEMCSDLWNWQQLNPKGFK